jgi:hypothetical protein
LIAAHKDELLKEIDHQLALGPERLAEENRFLLECNFEDMVSANGEQQEYWLLAIQAARETDDLREARRQRSNTGTALRRA